MIYPGSAFSYIEYFFMTRLNSEVKLDSGHENSDVHADLSNQTTSESKESHMKQKTSLLRALIRAYGVKYFFFQVRLLCRALNE